MSAEPPGAAKSTELPKFEKSARQSSAPMAETVKKFGWSMPAGEEVATSTASLPSIASSGPDCESWARGTVANLRRLVGWPSWARASWTWWPTRE